MSGSSFAPMNQIVEHLPWRVASLAGLLVGAISLAIGADVWACLLRVGAAFLLFGLVGLGLRAVLRQSASVTPPSHPPDHRGSHFDQTTPEDSLDKTSTPTSSHLNDV